MLGYNEPQEIEDDADVFVGEPVSNGIDWRSKGAVNAVKNQG